MPENKTIDPFHPTQPSIPGLDSGKAKAKLSPPLPAVYSSHTPEEKAPPSPMLWVVLTVLGAFLVFGGGFFYWMRNAPVKATDEASPAVGLRFTQRDFAADSGTRWLMQNLPERDRGQLQQPRSCRRHGRRSASSFAIQ